MHGGEIAFRRDREAGFDDVDTHSVEEFGDLELLLMRHGRAGALLAVAQGSVEDDDAVLLGLCLGSHWFSSFSIQCAGAALLRVYRGSPECPGAYAQPALRGG